MAYNICDNIATHGPFNQHLFMGCSVESFTTSVGLNEQGSELSVNLVQDCAVVPDGGNPKIVYNADLSSSYYYGADPGFINPGVGSPVYFRVGGMEFGGLLQSWTKRESTDGRPRYSVRLVDPRQILEGTQIILNNYSGGVGSCYNLINVFGFMERFGSNAVCIPATFEPTCSDTFPSALGFGGADSNDTGMPWNRIRVGTSVLIGSIPINSNIFSPFGRMVFKGAKTWGFGILPPDATDINLYNNFSSGGIEISAAYHDGNIAYYTLDLSEIPTLPDSIRIGGDSISLLELINQICDIISCDYYIELLYVPNGINVLKVIKVRIINRGQQPLLQSLDTYVNANQTIDFSIGNELRNETTTVFISGGLKETFYEVDIGTFNTTTGDFSEITVDSPLECMEDRTEAEKDYKILPYVGLDGNGNAIIADRDADDYWTWDGFDVRGLKLTMEGAVGVDDSITINEKELLCALGSKDSWLSYVASVRPDSYTLIDPNNEYNRENILGQFLGIINGQIDNNGKNANPWGAIKINKNPINNNPTRDKELERNFDKMYNFINEIGQNYGVKWMIAAPSSCVRRDSNTGEFVFSEVPTSTAWTDAATILGLTRPSYELDTFSDDTGKIECFVRYTDINDLDINIDKLPPDNFVKIDNSIYLKASADEGIVFADLATLCSPYYVITLSSRVFKREFSGDIRSAALGAVILAFGKDNITPEQRKAIEARAGRLFSLPSLDTTFYFDKIVIPVRSNINRYGPWITAGPPGQIKFEINEDLTPWNYGGSDAMCIAGQLLSDEGVSFQQAIESGSITVPGYPVYNGGSEFGSTIGGKNLYENRNYDTDGFSETAVGDTEVTNIDYIRVPSEQGGVWSGDYGPIITDINVDVGPQGIQTTYSFRTYTSKAGKLNKVNAERIKKLGNFRYKVIKRLNALKAIKDLNKKNKKRGIKEA